ncbi:ATP-dependent DNA helicase [Trichonephila clavipes]|nr:ATP-dependent DNA helicase [Trichonephila clavipes]
MTNIYYIALRNNPSHYTTIGRTTIDCIFSTHGLRTCGVYESAFSTHLPLYVQMPWEKKKVCTSYPQEDNDQVWNVAQIFSTELAKIDWAEDDFPN